MIQKTFGQLPLWQFENLARISKIQHFVSGRNGGVSEGELGTFNLGLKAGDHPDNVRENRRRLAVAMGIEPTHLVFPSQTHSATVKRVDHSTRAEELAETDALITDVPGICISVMSADCVPVLLYDPENKAAGAIHAGWRGTVSKILTHTVKQMQAQFGTKPEKLVAGIGPSICADVYEVGAEVVAEFENAFGNTNGLVHNRSREGKGFIDLWEANRRQLLELGVAQTSVEVAGICTYSQADQFFSARKSRNRAGRFAAGIMIQP